jgi:UDP-N-acetylmuramyl pentapeptide phosphotransferase/UDP-N-acetylglucosamine-1-phosphate transferase
LSPVAVILLAFFKVDNDFFTSSDGGIAIVGLIISLWLAYLSVVHSFDSLFLGYVICGLLEGLVDWVDDLRSVRSVRRNVRFLVQSVALVMG